MKIDISEITGILKQEMSRYAAGLNVVKVGRVLSVGDGIARINEYKAVYRETRNTAESR